MEVKKKKEKIQVWLAIIQAHGRLRQWNCYSSRQAWTTSYIVSPRLQYNILSNK